jgi:predicted ATP-binding protein involved in virulence
VDTESSIRLSSVAASNYRCFASLEWTGIHPSINVITAPNGKGKTALLDAVAVGLAPLPRFNSYTRGDKIEDPDVGRRRVGQQTLRTTSDVVIELTAELADRRATWRVERGHAPKNRTRTTPAEALRAFAADAWARRTVDAAPLPVVAYYGTSRLWASSRHTENRRGMEVSDGYRDCLDPRVDYQSFEAWVAAISHDRLNPASGTIARLDWDFLVGVLSAALAPVGLTQFEYSAGEQTLLAGAADQPMLPVRNQSDGIRTMLGMVGDVARRICLLNSGIPNFDVAQTPGVIMVDEVDLHLHPRWQQSVARALQTAFPRIQWILTTHSPQVVSTIPRDSVWIIDDETASLTHPEEQTEGARSGEVLAEVFQVDPLPDTDWREKLNRLDQLIDAPDDEVQPLLAEVEQHFGAHHELLRLWRLRRRTRAQAR